MSVSPPISAISMGSAASPPRSAPEVLARTCSHLGDGKKVLVGLAASPSASQLVRAGYEFSANGAWIAVHVETTEWHSPEDQRLLDESLTSARDLGAEIVVTRDQDVASALRRVAEEHAATHLIVGQTHPRRFGWFRS